MLATGLVQGPAMGQHFKQLNLPAEMCAGGDLTVHFGFEKSNEIVVVSQENTLGRSDTVFLPDGVPCNGSCAYQSPVTFTAFRPTDTIKSASDIKYIRIKLEHSYIGDLYMNIGCPNGQKADIMKFAGTGISECDTSISVGSRGWSNGDNMSEDNHFGMANDHDNADNPCSSSAPGNGPGYGWNYCWSSNNTSGYKYASGDGIVYRKGHAHNGRVDSSDVASETNFYHPDESFETLVGCPLNGTWTITVIDGYSIDNGYIFEWELTLDASLLPPVKCVPKTYYVLGGVSKKQNDSTFVLIGPTNLKNDTSITYTFRMFTTCGDTIDTTATILYHPTPEGWLDDTVCDNIPYLIGNQRITGSGHHDVIIPLPTGCDSTLHLNLTVYPSYDIVIEASTCPNEPYTFENSIYRQAGVYTHRFTTLQGCDSLRTLLLSVTDGNLKAHILAAPQVIPLDRPFVHLSDQSRNHVSHKWMIEGLESNDEEMTIRYPLEIDSMVIMLEALSPNGCADTDTVVLRPDRTMVLSPNIFTPELESNNRWCPQLVDIDEVEVWIYNRQGQLVAHLGQAGESWDGNMPDGRHCPTGTYVYTLRYRSIHYPEREQQLTGSVTLIR